MVVEDFSVVGGLVSGLKNCVVAVTGVSIMIVLFAVFAGYFPDLAIDRVNVHGPEPILMVRADNVQLPLRVHFFFPGEFDEARDDSCAVAPARSAVIFHVMVVFVAADAGGERRLMMVRQAIMDRRTFFTWGQYLNVQQ